MQLAFLSIGSIQKNDELTPNIYLLMYSVPGCLRRPPGLRSRRSRRAPPRDPRRARRARARRARRRARL